MNCFAPAALVLLLVAAIAGVHAGDKENDKKCASEWNIQESDIRRVFHEGPTNQNEKCFLGCAFTAGGLIVNGQFSAATARAKVAERYKDNADALKVANDSIDTCSKEVTGTDACETGTQLRACIERTAKQLFSASR
ncbi:hypothetical protein R5R35_006757 [Gryllus longicercus]|uniref:Odorant binding protein n=1 Tax=Gryllus longicercus TaxID=2509291 RepID=A0AAN9YYJ4_9ORTH